MKYLKKYKIWLIITIITLFNIFSIGKLIAQTNPNPYANPKLSLDELEKLYHGRINELFNNKLKLLEKGDKGGGTNKIPEGDNCEENNYSTFCLALAAIKEYEQYEEVLLNRKTYIEVDPDTIPYLTEESLKLIAQENRINNELVMAQRALDVSLATYNEIMTAYVMHKEYEKIIESLIKYKNKLLKLRKEIERFPSKFIDATTASCT
jgi:hypothetical protein